MNAIANNSYTRFLAKLGSSIPQPSAIVLVSAHWQTRGTFVTAHPEPPQIYDFYGFPEALYKIKYTVSGYPRLAEHLTAVCKGVFSDQKRGHDHAAWAPLVHMYPSANIPVLSLSLDRNLTIEGHFAMGKELARCLPEDVLLLGSGNLVHNLNDVSFDDTVSPFPWAKAADEWFSRCIEEQDLDSLLNFRQKMPEWQHSVPTDEHLLPLFYMLGAAQTRKGSKMQSIYEEIQNGSISMRCIEFT